MKKDIVLMTDFGLATGYVGAMYGVIRKVDRELCVFDLNHEIRAFDMKQASELLLATIPFWNEGTVFVSVVDPGVGTKRKSGVALLKNGSYVVSPDNGTFTAIKDQIVMVREIDESINRLPGSENGNTFHGRDVYAYTAARLASGIISYEQVGPEYSLDEIVLYKKYGSVVSDGRVECVVNGAEKHFGGLSFTVTAADFKKSGIGLGDWTHITITKDDNVLFDDDVMYHWSFGYVAVGEPILYNGSTSIYVSLSLNQRSFVDKYLPDIFAIGSRFEDYKVVITKKEK